MTIDLICRDCSAMCRLTTEESYGEYCIFDGKKCNWAKIEVDKRTFREKLRDYTPKEDTYEKPTDN